MYTTDSLCRNSGISEDYIFQNQMDFKVMKWSEGVNLKTATK